MPALQGRPGMSTCNVGDRTKADRCLAVAGRSDVLRDLAMLNVTRPGTRSALLHYVSCPILRTPGPASTSPKRGHLFASRVLMIAKRERRTSR